jgi:ribonuclease P/MRP protein subunit POP5
MGVLNPLPPSKREKNRYLVYGLSSEKPLNGEEMGKAIWKSALGFLGELGVAKSGLRIVDFDEAKQKGIIKVNRDSVEEGRVVLSLVKEVSGSKTALETIGVSGILKKARGKYLA